MPRLSLEPTSAFLTVELVTSAIIPPAGQADPAFSFDRYLQEATAAAYQSTESYRSPSPAPPPQPNDDGTPTTGSESSQENRSTVSESASDSDRPAAPSEPPSEAESETRVSDPEAASDEQSDQNEEEEARKPEADPAVTTISLDVEGLSQPDSVEVSQADPMGKGGADESRAGAPETTSREVAPAATGELPLGDDGESASSGAEKSPSIEIETEAVEQSSAERDGITLDATITEEGEASDDGGREPSDRWTEAGHDRGAASPASDEVASSTADSAPAGRASPADSSPRENRDPDAEGPEAHD